MLARGRVYLIPDGGLCVARAGRSRRTEWIEDAGLVPSPSKTWRRTTYKKELGDRVHASGATAGPVYLIMGPTTRSTRRGRDDPHQLPCQIPDALLDQLR